MPVTSTKRLPRATVKYFTIGAGLRYNVFGLDFAYLIPTTQRNPLENTLRFTLIFDFEGLKKKLLKNKLLPNHTQEAVLLNSTASCI